MSENYCSKFAYPKTLNDIHHLLEQRQQTHWSEFSMRNVVVQHTYFKMDSQKERQNKEPNLKNQFFMNDQQN